ENASLPRIRLSRSPPYGSEPAARTWVHPRVVKEFVGHSRSRPPEESPADWAHITSDLVMLQSNLSIGCRSTMMRVTPVAIVPADQLRKRPFRHKIVSSR